MARPVYVVHCVDTEGPLHESVEATFERLKAIFGIDLEPSVALLRQLQAGEVDLGGLEQAVRKVVDPHLLGYNDTWDKIDGMLASCMSPAFREQTVDSEGHGWVYNWFCVDHVDYDLNPRRRDIGHHNIYDHYQGVLRETGSAQDGVQFHYHPHNFRREANRCAAHWWASSDSLVQILCRRVIDRRWFPAAHRAGFHVIRPDSHWFLEQHIPFDLSSQAVAAVADDSAQSGLDDGRWGDWRRAPVTWEPYHPAHDDYQERGACRRWIARCLNIGTRYRLLGEEHVRQAFAEAEADRPVVLAFTNHDFRDMRPDIDGVRELLDPGGTRVPGAFRSSSARSSPPCARRCSSRRSPPASSRSRSPGPARPPTSSRSGHRSRPSGRSRGWPCAPSPARITTTTSISTSRSTAGATSSMRRPTRSALSTPSAWPPTTPTA